MQKTEIEVQKQTKTLLLRATYDNIAIAAYHGEVLGSGRNPVPVEIEGLGVIAGPRAGAILIDAGMDAGRIMAALNRNEAAKLRQAIAFPFAGNPFAMMDGSALRLEIAWPSNLARTMIPLSCASDKPLSLARWSAGETETGQTCRPALGDDSTAHVLVSGCTRSGKTVALRGAVKQLASRPQNSVVLLDGKFARGLGPCKNLPAVVGPVATTLEHAKTALTWANIEMRRRFETMTNQGLPHWPDGRLIVVADEVHEFCQDSAFADLLSKLVRQGGEAGCHVILATQHPSVGVFQKPEIRRQLEGRIVLRMTDYEASKMATGQADVRADFLQGRGDAYVITSRGTQRVQIYFVDQAEIDGASNGGKRLIDWETADVTAADVGQELPEPKRGAKKSFAPEQVGGAIIAAHNGDGRPTFRAWLERNEIAIPGSDRLHKLHRFGKAVLSFVESNGYRLLEAGD